MRHPAENTFLVSIPCTLNRSIFQKQRLFTKMNFQEKVKNWWAGGSHRSKNQKNWNFIADAISTQNLTQSQQGETGWRRMTNYESKIYYYYQIAETKLCHLVVDVLKILQYETNQISLFFTVIFS
jgi:hypothetical protein